MVAFDKKGKASREFEKFVESSSGNVAIRVVPVDSSGEAADSVKITDGTHSADVLGRTAGTETPADTDNALVVYDVGSGGSSSTLVATHTSPQDFSVAYTSSTTITVSGASFSVDDGECTVVYVLYKPTGGEWQSPLVQGAGGASLVAASNVITVAGAGTPFASGDEYIIGVQYQKKNYSLALDASQTVELSPLSENFVGETLADVTGEGDGTTYYYVDMSGHRNGTFQIEDTPGAAGDNTYTFEASNQDDGTAAASCTYQDVTQYGMENFVGAAAASFTTDAFVGTTDMLNCKWLRVKVVRANDGGNTDGAWTILAKRWY